MLIVDDHPLMIEGYRSILEHNSFGYPVIISSANNCEEAFHIITNQANQELFDLIFIDINLPPYKKELITTGEDIISLARKYLKDCKVVIITSYAEAFKLYNIIKLYHPEGLLVKSDFNANELISALRRIIEGETYHSYTVVNQLKNITSRKEYLDNYNRQIISLLSQGIKSKNLPDYLPLSMSAIDKRKSQIKDYFFIDGGNDEDILREARALGFI